MFQKLLQRIAVKAATSLPAEWYERNGFSRIGASYRDEYGFGSGEAAFAVGAFFAGTKVIAEDVGTQPFFLYRRKGGNLSKATEHTLYGILHDMPNPDVSAGTFVETLTAHAVVCGTGYARIKRNAGGEVISLWTIMPDKIRCERDKETGEKFFSILDDGTWRPVPRREIFDLPGFSWDGWSGIDVAKLSRVALRLANAQESYALNFFERDHTPGIILEHPGTLKPEAVMEIKKKFKETVQSHDVAVTQEGMKANVVQRSHSESQLVEQRRQQLLEVCRRLRISPHKLADLERMTFSNVEQMQIDHTTNVLAPWNKRWRQTVHRCLLSPEERKAGYFAEHSVESFLRGDFRTQTDGFRAMLEKGVLSINDVRGWMNLNPVEGGDAHFIQLNMQTVVDAATGVNQVTESGRVRIQGAKL